MSWNSVMHFVTPTSMYVTYFHSVLFAFSGYCLKYVCPYKIRNVLVSSKKCVFKIAVKTMCLK